MPFLAHVGIILDCDYTAYKKDSWQVYLRKGTHEIRWRFRNDLMYEIAAGPFDDRYTALKIAKCVFITSLINFLYGGIPVQNAGLQFYEHRLYVDGADPYASSFQEFTDSEAFFFWNPNYIGDEIGVGVYEIPNSSIEEISLYSPSSTYHRENVYLTDDRDRLCFNNLEGHYFSFDREVRTVFLDLFEAEKNFDYGFKATKYCGILENLSTAYNKEPEVIAEIDKLIEHVDQSALSAEQKNSLSGLLKNGKTISSRNKCQRIVEDYGKCSRFFEDSKRILNNVYKQRNKFSHGTDCREEYIPDIERMKYIVLDVVICYFQTKESNS